MSEPEANRVGLGSYFVGVVATVALIITLALLRIPSRWLRRFAVGKETVVETRLAVLAEREDVTDVDIAG